MRALGRFARRGVRSRRQSLQLPGAEGERPGTVGRGAKQPYLAVVTEVMAKEHVELVCEVRRRDASRRRRSVQNAMLTVGSGGQGGPAGVAEARPVRHDGRVLAGRQYILKTGNQKVILCSRGIRTFEDHTRFTLPLASVPYLHAKTHLPVVVDPSHGTGKASLVATMAVARDRRRRGRIDRGDPSTPRRKR